MEEIIKNVKTSSMFNETEHLIKEMIENIGKFPIHTTVISDTPL
jgi:hypothetical protein